MKENSWISIHLNAVNHDCPGWGSGVLNEHVMVLGESWELKCAAAMSVCRGCSQGRAAWKPRLVMLLGVAVTVMSVS